MRIEIADGVRVYVDIDGAGLVPEGPTMVERPTVVLLHGGPGLDHSVYKGTVLDGLTEVAQVVYYDHRSQGRSDPRPPDEWTLDVWADDVVRVCDALGVEHPIVIGASFGGFVAQHYLARHPEHPAKVVLACTAPRLDLDAQAAAFTRFGTPEAGATARRFFAGDPEAFGDFLTHCLPLYSTEPANPDAFARPIMNLPLQEHFMKGEGRTMELLVGLAQARCPVLVISGELDPVCPIELAEEIVDALPAELVTFVRLAGASHMDVPGDDGIDAVRRFITSDAPVDASGT